MKSDARLTENMEAEKKRKRMWNLAWVSGRPF